MTTSEILWTVFNKGFERSERDDEIVVTAKRSKSKAKPQSNGCVSNYTLSGAGRLEGGGASILGSALEIGGLVVGVFVPPVGATIGLIGATLDYGGQAITFGSDIADGDRGAIFSDVLSAGVGFGNKKPCEARHRRVAKRGNRTVYEE
ncbi:hypothetical protein [Sphingomonas sp. Leaf357]|uniref:hypothetical protein n=1 Tax=Sphingomonas sp. Leaf357 TaxID=1736350 RepID=UPI0012E19579|nr:hypothetical protein [Sphingomonas sp. Leaf357]